MMSETQNNLGEKFKATITEAMKTGDFRSLNALVTDTVNDALREADFQANLARENTEKKVWNSQRNWQDKKREEVKTEAEIRAEREERERQQEERRRQNEEWHRQRADREKQWEEERKTRAGKKRMQQAAPGRATAAEMMSLVKMEKKGNVSGTLCTVFGGIGLGFSGLGLLIQSLLTIPGTASLSALILPGVFSAIFLEMIFYGNGQKNRLKRAEKYLELCGTKMYGVINEMARYTGKSVRFVRRDLRRMLKAGMFPDGHLDEKETCFMLNDVIYHQYLETEKAYLAQKEIAEQKKEQEIPKNESPESTQSDREQELHSMVAEGMEYIRHLRELNDEIKGEVISGKLYQLENLLKEIFNRVQEHPEQMHRMHKLMEYYLPTMLKLVEQYAEFDRMSSPGEDVQEAKAEIEKTLDMINQAFVTLLNNLFRDAAFDASADAQVLQTMLAKEGLTESDFTMGKKHE